MCKYECTNDPNFVADGIEETRYYMENVKLLARPIVPQANTEFISEMGSLFQQYVSDEITLEEFCASGQKVVIPITNNP